MRHGIYDAIAGTVGGKAKPNPRGIYATLKEATANKHMPRFGEKCTEVMLTEDRPATKHKEGMWSCSSFTVLLELTRNSETRFD